MKIAIVGSRECGDAKKRLAEIHELIVLHDRKCTVVSGGARGIDSLARFAAKSMGCQYQEFPADWDRFGRRAGFLRNQEIVDACDEVHAWWDGKSRGTAHTIGVARKTGKKVTIHEIEERRK